MSTETPWSTPLPAPHSDDHTHTQLPLARRTGTRDEVAAFAVVTGASVVLSFAVGAFWRGLAPDVLGVVNQGGVYYAAPESETFIGRDGWFALFACIAAVLLALGSFVRYRRGGSIGAALGLAAGGIGGGYLAAWFGALIGPGRGSILRAAHTAANGTTFDLPMTLRATGVVWLWPAVAAGLFFFLLLLFGPSEPEAEQPAFPGWGAQQSEQYGAASGPYPHPHLNPSPYETTEVARAEAANGHGGDTGDTGGGSGNSGSDDVGGGGGFGSNGAPSPDAGQPLAAPDQLEHRHQSPEPDQRSE